MQEKINSFNAAFVDLAAGYVNRVAIRAAQKEPEPKGAAQQFRHELANEIQLANLLAATIGKMQAASGGEFPQDEQEDGKPHTAAGNMEFLRDFLEGKTRWNFPEGTVFNVNTSTGDGAAVQLKPEADGEPEPPERPEPVVKSELREIKEIRIPAEPNTPGVWELMRDILAGKRPAPEGTVFDVVIDMTGNPQAIRSREEPEPAPRALAIAMPGGETVKLNSAAEAYRLAGCIEEMAARVWPKVKPDAPQDKPGE